MQTLLEDAPVKPAAERHTPAPAAPGERLAPAYPESSDQASEAGTSYAADAPAEQPTGPPRVSWEVCLSQSFLPYTSLAKLSCAQVCTCNAPSPGDRLFLEYACLGVFDAAHRLSGPASKCKTINVLQIKVIDTVESTLKAK